jgi:hypothetical protein
MGRKKVKTRSSHTPKEGGVLDEKVVEGLHPRLAIGRNHGVMQFITGGVYGQIATDVVFFAGFPTAAAAGTGFKSGTHDSNLQNKTIQAASMRHLLINGDRSKIFSLHTS